MEAYIERPVKFLERENMIVDANGRGVVDVVMIYDMTFDEVRLRAEEIVEAINSLRHDKRNKKEERSDD